VSKVSQFANKLAFFTYLRMNREKIIEELQKKVSAYGMEKLKEIIRKGEYPDVAPDIFTQASGHIEYIEAISVEYLFELIAEGVPELAEYIISMGIDGVVYLAKLRLHFLELCRHPEQAPAVASAPSTDTDFVTVKCDKCSKAFPVKKSELAKLEECPFCHASAK
jgi:hypothetical protein